MITIYDISEIAGECETYKWNWTLDQIKQIQNSHFVFIMNPAEEEYQCIKNRQDGTTYFGSVFDFNWDLADKIMYFSKDESQE